jgi:hypothetical protein
MSAPGDIDITREFRNAITYGTVAVVVGPDPDEPGEFGVEAFYIAADHARRQIAARDIAAALRLMADSIEADGVPL